MKVLQTCWIARRAKCARSVGSWLLEAAAAAALAAAVGGAATELLRWLGAA